MILCVNLNGAVDRSLVVERFAAGRVHRAAEVRSSAGGKGANVAAIATLLGRRATVIGFAGGATGGFIREDLARRSIPSVLVEMDGESRVCYNILDPATQTKTEILEPGGYVAPAQWERLRQQYQELLRSARVVTLSGSLPPGLPADAYADLIRLAHDAGVPALLDSSGQAMKEGLLARPYLIKPNQDEVEALLGVRVESREEALQAVQRLAESGVQVALLSLGERGALLRAEEGLWEVRPPSVAVRNTVGCGDAMLAGFAIGLAEGMPLVEAARLATAAAAAKAESSLPGVCEPARVAELLPYVKPCPICR